VVTAFQQRRKEPVSPGVVATASAEATDAATQIFAQGGNAMDAAVAAAWALCVCEPSGSGLGGHTVLLHRSSDGAFSVIDGQSLAPATASLENIASREQRAGYRATTVPSTPATLGYAQNKFGVLPSDRVFRPAIRLAENGFTVTRLHRRQLLWTLALLKASPSARALLLRDGNPPEVGELFRQPALARTLRCLAAQGTRDFYAGQTAAKIVRDMERNGGLIEAQDLATADVPIERQPISMEYRGHNIVTVPFPYGGRRLLSALQALKSLWSETSTGGYDQWYTAIASATRETLAATWKKRGLCAERGGETTHLCVADGQGNIVSLTQSIQSLFGAKVGNAELGFLYNNYLCTCPRSPHPSQLRGRCRPRSNVAPTVVLKSGKPVLVTGAAGSRRIVSSLLQTISGLLDLGLTAEQAIATPRVHALASGRIWIEAPAATPQLLEAFAQLYAGARIKPALSFKMGAVQAIQFHDDGRVMGVADPRRQGSATSLRAGWPI